MSDANASRLDPRSASLALAGAMCVIPFLQSRHFPPIRTFYDEWLAFSLGLAAMGAAAVAHREARVRIPALSLWTGLFALMLILRALSGQSAYLQSPLLWGFYALFAALLVTLGQDFATQLGQERTCDTLAAFLLFGALANSIAGVLQVTGIPPPIDAFVSYLHGKRAVGNVGQANLYANYLALGAASLVYLFARGKVGWPAASAAGLLLLAAATLAASRSSFLYLGYFALLGWIALRRNESAAARRLGNASIVLAITGLLLHWLVPALLTILGYTIEDGFSRNTPAQGTSAQETSSGLRLLVWGLAWRMFETAPWFGAGPGEFAGAAFVHGMPVELASGDIWASPHNLILQLLSETGLAGTVPVVAGLLLWVRRSGGKFLRAPTPAIWWVVACVGVELTHALLEYPLWYAHFLALTALLMGVGASGGITLRALAARMVYAASALAGVVALAVTLQDYLRFELASPVSTGRSMAPDSEVLADRATLHGLGHGLLAPRTEVWLFLALPLESDGLDGKLALGERVLRVWPSSQVVSHQAVFLALAGRDDAARALLTKGLKASTTQREKIAAIIATAPQAARSVLQPALGFMRQRKPE